MKSTDATNDKFYGLGIAPRLLDVLARLKFTTPTPIQRQAIPIAMQGKDVIGVAQTGTGKTLAFGLPMLQRLSIVKGRGLVLLPTRELALQVEEVLRSIGRSFGLRTAVLIGGASMRAQLQALARNPHIVVATPGRLNDHLMQRTLTLKNVHILVLDEADRMLDMGFLPQIQKILHALPREKQTMLFSATISAGIMKIATATMRLPLRIEISPSGTTAERVSQEIFIVRKDSKTRLLEKILKEYQGSTLVFTRTKYGARALTRTVKTMGYSAAEIHSNRSLHQRRDALDGFKSGKYRVLIATDIAARGIDVQRIELVLNYDLPRHAEDYVHRIGRTGRAGAVGHAISFAGPEEKVEIRAIERLIRKNLRITPLPDLPPARPRLPEPPRGPRPPSRHGRGPGQGVPGHAAGRGYRRRRW